MGVIVARNIFEESSGIYFITGLVGLRPPRIFGKAFPGYVYIAILLFAYYFLYFWTLEDNLKLYEVIGNYSRTSTIRIGQIFFNLIFLIITIVSSLIASSKIRHICAEISVIDEKLRILNVSLDYTKFTRADFAQICEIIIITIGFNLIDYFPQINPSQPKMLELIWIVNTLPRFVNSLAIANFVIFMKKLRRRIEAINEYIPDMMIFEKNVVNTLQNDMNCVFRLRLLNRIHEKLINAVTELNDSHNIILLTTFVIYFVACCLHLRTIVTSYENKNEIHDTLIETLWVIFYLGTFIAIIGACHNVTLQGKLSGRLLHEKWTDVDHHPLKQETDVLARRIESRNLQLTACNFFVIDYPALKMIIVGLAAYLFIVTQTLNTCNKKK